MDTSGRIRQRAFTLVELLVVIGIIAVLVSILLPALNRARRQANTVQCASNMRQIALALLTYTNDNHGVLIPAEIASSVPFPYGFFWSSELVRQKYIAAPPMVFNGTTANPPAGGSMGVFQCPEAWAPTDYIPSPAGKQGKYPTDPNNNTWCDGVPYADTAQNIFYATGTYYQLNCRQTGYSSNYTIGGLNNPPFVYFEAPTDAMGQTTAQDLANGQYRRNISQIKHTALMVMIGESADLFWVSNTTSTVNGVIHYAPSLGARHGQRSADGTNAYTNFAFFDGHVELFPTARIDQTPAPAYNPGTDGLSAMTESSGTIFTLYNDK